MVFIETGLKGALIIELQKAEDARGFFARAWCEETFKGLGLNSKLVQCNISFNRKKGTLRGMHYQVPPYEEAKLVRCTRGAIYDVIVDLRPDSPTFRRWVATELTADNRRAVYVPEKFTHGFQTLEDDAEVFYLMSEVYDAQSARGVRWNDPAFRIDWPVAEGRIMSERDAAFADFSY